MYSFDISADGPHVDSDMAALNLHLLSGAQIKNAGAPRRPPPPGGVLAPLGIPDVSDRRPCLHRPALTLYVAK